MPPEVTPNGQFYQVSKNFFDPTVDTAKWSLEVKGLVEKPLKLTLEEFRKAAPPVERYQTFECISNEDGGALALGGWAFAGNRGISRVEFSPDGGTTWLPAAVKESLGENCWQFWSATWTPPHPGDYTIKVRAADGTGALQPAEPKP